MPGPPESPRPAWVRLVIAQGIANLGDGMSSVAFPLLASFLTRDPALIALVTAAVRFPWVLAVVAGVIVDRVNRKRLLVGMLAIQAGVIALITFGTVIARDRLVSSLEPLPGGETWLIALVVAALIVSVAEVLRDLGSLAFVPEIVPTSDLERANSRLYGAEIVAGGFVGAPIGGVLVGLAVWSAFGVHTAALVVSAWLILSLRGAKEPDRVLPEDRAPVSTDLKDGVRWLWRHRLLRDLTLSIAAANLALGIAMATWVLFAQEILGLGPAGFGLLATGAAAGGFLASITAERIARRLGRGRTLVATIGTTGVAHGLIGLSSWPVVVWFLFGLSALLGVVSSVVARSLRQRIAPGHMLGRVFGAHRTLAWGAAPLGTLIGGGVVSVLEGPLGREWALRSPLLLGFATTTLIFLFVKIRLNDSRIDAAIAEAEEE